jgi:cytidine deaminase
MDYKELIQAARKAKKNSHSPYSKFRVGAALLTKSGKIYTGCNIENSSYSLTVCAERTALFKAVSEGEKKFLTLVISTDVKDFISPCGACRQVISDLAGDIDIILTNRVGKTKIMKMNELLPHPFTPKNLK